VLFCRTTIGQSPLVLVFFFCSLFGQARPPLILFVFSCSRILTISDFFFFPLFSGWVGTSKPFFCVPAPTLPPTLPVKGDGLVFFFLVQIWVFSFVPRFPPSLMSSDAGLVRPGFFRFPVKVLTSCFRAFFSNSLMYLALFSECVGTFSA